MIVRNGSRVVFVCCDWCDVRVSEADFFDALEAFRRRADGRIFQKKGRWMHCCGKCRHSDREPLPLSQRDTRLTQEDTLPVVLPSQTAAQILDRKKRRLDFDEQEVKAPVIPARKLDL